MLYRGRDKREFYLASLLYDSIEYQHIESVKSLLKEKGADPNLVLSKKGISPFHLAVGCQSYEFALEVITLILRHGGNPNVRSDDGLTPVHIAAAWGRIELLELLLKNGGDPTIRDVSRKNPLHYALEEGYTDCLNLLKCYLPVKNDLIKDDEDTHGCCLILDKIIVQNGLTVGEYVVTNEQTGTLSITPPPTNLQSLPQTNTTDYVLSWVSDQQIQKNSYLNSMGSVGESLDSSTSFDRSDESLVESDGNNEAKRYDPKCITFRKNYRKTRSKSKSPKSTKSKKSSTNETSVVDETFYTDTQNTTSFQELSRESGVVTIPSSTGRSIFLMNQTDKKNASKLEKSSDYFTCSHNNSINSLERNIFEITEDLSALNVISVNEKEDDQLEKPHESSNELSFVSVSEVYKYVDEEENVVLYEKRYLNQKTSSDCARSPRSSNVSSLSSLPPTFDYDTDTLRQELTRLGFNPGPITSTTKRIYLKKLHHLKEHPSKTVKENQPQKRDNGLALTPPMGWLSWQRFRCLADCSVYPNECLSEDLIKRTADKMVSDGYLAAGYEYIIIDDCWAEKYRSDDSKLIADSERFPSGMKALSDYIHNLGLKFGIYGDYGYFTCGGYPGSYNYLEQDAQTFADWGVDYLKLDGCYVPNVTSMEEGYARMSNFLNATGRPIVFSCSFPAYKGLEADYSLAVKYCNLWRNYGDIQDQWSDVVDIATWFSDNQDFLRQYAGPGHWNDPDMLIIGNFGLSFEQSKSQMTIWSILAAPLIMSVDLDTIRPEFKEILLNQNAIKINQDALGIPGQLVSNDSDITVWSKPLTGSNGKPGLALGVVSYRVDGYFYPYKIQLSDFFNDVRTEYTITDVFDESSELNGVISGTANITVRVPPSGAVLLMLTP